MRKISFFLIALICCSFTSAPSLTETERSFAVKHLTETKAYLENAIKGLTEEQMKFKPSAERWSIAECLEHIANTETLVYGSVTNSLTQPTNPEKRSEIKVTDEELLTKLVDRSGKAKAPEILQPTGKYATAKEIIDAFMAQRNKEIEFVQTTKEDLRNHVSPHPFFGMIDSYQWLLLNAGHQKRHTLQIEEVKADKNFPKK